MLIKKIKNKNIKIGVIGLGYVGLPLALEFVKNGFETIGFDISQEKCDQVNSGQSYIDDISDTNLLESYSSKKFTATTDFSKLSEVDSIHICVPTPLVKTSDPDMSYILSACDNIKKNLKKDTLIVLESTTYPGTTNEIFVPLIKNLGYTVGEDVFIAFSPERIDPGNKKYSLSNTPKILGGVTEKCSEVAKALYENIVCSVVIMSSTKAAEMVKLLENTFRSVNIALANELAQMCKILELDSFEIINAAASKPFGFMPFYPGPGLGGHCIPVDPHYLSWKLKTLNYQTRFIDLASKINTEMPHYIVSLVQDQLNRVKKSIKGSKILIVGVSYKQNVSDTRESPALDIFKILIDKEAEISYYDPLVPYLSIEKKKYSSLSLNEDTLECFDHILICTKHDAMDIDLILRSDKLILDTRNVSQGIKNEKIVRI